jgi:hypothetical protein
MWDFFKKIEDNGAPSLLIIFQWAMRIIYFWLQQSPPSAGWLWLKPQANRSKRTIFCSNAKKGAGLSYP